MVQRSTSLIRKSGNDKITPYSDQNPELLLEGFVSSVDEVADWKHIRNARSQPVRPAVGLHHVQSSSFCAKLVRSLTRSQQR